MKSLSEMLTDPIYYWPADEVSDNIIIEALNEPHLLELAKQLSSGGGNSGMKSFRSLYKSLNIKWDEVDMTRTKIYNQYDKDCEKACRMVYSGRGGTMLLLVKNDTTDKYVFMTDGFQFGQEKRVWKIGDAAERVTWNGENRMKSSEIEYYLSNLSKKSDKYSYIIINLNNTDDQIMDTWRLRSDRNNARKDMVLQGDPEYYKKVARENIARYKEIIASHRSAANAEFDKIDKMVHDSLTKAMEIINKVHKDPTKYINKKYDLSRMTTLLYSTQTWNNGKTSGYDGLMPLYERYNSTFLELVNKQSYNPERSQADLQRYKQGIIKIVNDLNNIYFPLFV